jgi:hypothetical protein
MCLRNVGEAETGLSRPRRPCAGRERLTLGNSRRWRSGERPTLPLSHRGSHYSYSVFSRCSLKNCKYPSSGAQATKNADFQFMKIAGVL